MTGKIGVEDLVDVAECATSGACERSKVYSRPRGGLYVNHPFDDSVLATALPFEVRV